MKKNLLILCALLLTTLGASAESSWTAPDGPTGSTLTSGNKYYLYNTEAEQFMGQVHLLWGTEAGFSDTGLIVTLNSSGGAYTITTSSGGVFFDGTYLYVDGSNKNDSFTFTAANDGTYTIQTASDGYLGYDGTAEIKTTLTGSDTGIYWVLIAQDANFDIDLYHALVLLYNTLVHAESYGMTDTDEAYAAAGTVYLSSDATVEAVMEAVAALEVAMEGYASEEDPDDVTYEFITNPDFDTYTGSTGDTFAGDGWTNSGMTLQATNIFINDDENITISVYPEKWTNSSGSLDDAKIYQTLANLPKGVYQLEADAIAVKQNTETTATGVSLYAGTRKALVHTGDGAPEHFTVSFEVTEDESSVEIGFEVSSTNANWVAVDNFRLYYLGEKLADDCDYEKGDEVTIGDVIYTVKSDNMFDNGGFNNGVLGWTAGNTYTYALSASKVTINSTGGYNNKPYITLPTDVGAGDEATPTQAIAVEPGKTYLFVGYTSGEDPGDNNHRYSALFAMQSANEEAHIMEGTTSYGKDIIILEWGNSSTEWTQTIGVFSVPAENEDGSFSYVGMRMNWSKGSYDGFQLYEVEEVVEWTLTTAQWGTLILPFDADLKDYDTNLLAYSCSSVDSDGTLDLGTGVTSIAANTPYIIGVENEISADKTYEFTGVPTNTADSYTAGLLTGTFVDMDYSDLIALDGTVYLLQNHDGEGEEGVAFYPVVDELSAEATLTPYHCYLKDSSANGVRASISFPSSDEATAIMAVESEEVEANGAIYDLSGRRVSKAVKGVYIQNGKKVLVK